MNCITSTNIDFIYGRTINITYLSAFGEFDHLKNLKNDELGCFEHCMRSISLGDHMRILCHTAVDRSTRCTRIRGLETDEIGLQPEEPALLQKLWHL